MSRDFCSHSGSAPMATTTAPALALASGCQAASRPSVTAGPVVYQEDFRSDNGGWFGFKGNFDGTVALRREGDAVASYGPWWIDYNHAPPHGGGYLSLLFGLMTRGPLNEPLKEYGGVNRFI